MIYFTKITDPSNKKGPQEAIEFQFYPKELPENISINRRTKINKIEYNGGMISNQIIGVYYEPIEWEGCFFGTYMDNSISSKSITAKERADKLAQFLGMPIRCVFAVPSGNEKEIPGIGDVSNNDGKNSEPSKVVGHRGVYIMESLDITIHNYADVDYKIVLVPHMRQEKIKPKEVSVQAIKIIPENISKASDSIKKAGKEVKGNGAKGTAKKSTRASKIAKILSESAEYNLILQKRSLPDFDKLTMETITGEQDVLMRTRMNEILQNAIDQADSGKLNQ
jgi:hypothetical protein